MKVNSRSGLITWVSYSSKQSNSFVLKDIERKKEGHHIPAGTAHKKTAPPIVSAESVDDDRIFSVSGRVEDYELRAGCHLFSESHFAMARRALPLCEISFFCSSVMSARVIPGYASAMNIGS